MTYFIMSRVSIYLISVNGRASKLIHFA